MWTNKVLSLFLLYLEWNRRDYEQRAKDDQNIFILDVPIVDHDGKSFRST